MGLVDFFAGAFESGIELALFDLASLGDSFDQGFFVWRENENGAESFFEFVEVSFVQGFLDLDQALDVQFFQDGFAFF